VTVCVYDEQTGQARPMQPGEPYPPLPPEARDLIRVIFQTRPAEDAEEVPAQ
jgi:hypothetical protein